MLWRPAANNGRPLASLARAGLAAARPLPPLSHTLTPQPFTPRGSRRGLNLTKTTLNNGYLGSRNDEERSEMRYVV